jgi:hypothetical protein
LVVRIPGRDRPCQRALVEIIVPQNSVNGLTIEADQIKLPTMAIKS